MNILHVVKSDVPIPPRLYGGTERIVWSLTRNQRALGHDVRFMQLPSPAMPDDTLIYDRDTALDAQIDDWPDVVHCHWAHDEDLSTPCICTEHSNGSYKRRYHRNTVFLSQKHAANHHADYYIYNGLDWDEYGEPEFEPGEPYLHFLAMAKSKSKNLRDAIRISRAAKLRLHVLGGEHYNFDRKNPYFYTRRAATFHGMVGGEEKLSLIRNSSGLLLPVRWHEPFGLAVIESLYLGCPVFATPYGAIPEIVSSTELGTLSTSRSELIDAARNFGSYDRVACHEHAKQNFDAMTMTKNYIQAYERVIAGEALNAEAPYAERSLRKILPAMER